MTVVANSYEMERNMKLKQFQQERIEEIIREEMKSLKESLVSADYSRRNSMLSEKNLFEVGAPVEQDLSADSLSSALDQTMMESAQTCVQNFDNELLMHIASILKSYGLLASGDNADSVYNMLSDYDEDSMTLAQQECATDIVIAFEKYVSEMAILAAGVYSGQE
jgi:hypothetical protein